MASSKDSENDKTQADAQPYEMAHSGELKAKSQMFRPSKSSSSNSGSESSTTSEDEAAHLVRFCIIQSKMFSYFKSDSYLTSIIIIHP